jgi:hypothetical protein
MIFSHFLGVNGDAKLTQNCDIHLFYFISSNITLRVILGLVKSNIVIGFEIKNLKIVGYKKNNLNPELMIRINIDSRYQ